MVTAVPVAVSFRSVPRFTRVSANVHLFNHTRRPITVAMIRPTCGCTSSQMHDRRIEAGKSGTLTVTLETSDFLGLVHKGLGVTFRGDVPGVFIPVTAVVRRELEMSPLSLDLGTIRLGSSGATTLHVDRVTGARLPDLAVEPVPEVSAVVHRRGPKGADVTVVARPTGWAGQRSPVLTIDTGVPSVPKLTVPLAFQAVGRYRLVPSDVNFGVVSGSARQTVRILVPGVDEGHLPRVQSLPRGISATVARAAGGAEVTASCRATRGRKDLVAGSIRLTTGDPVEPIIKIPVYAALKG